MEKFMNSKQHPCSEYPYKTDTALKVTDTDSTPNVQHRFWCKAYYNAYLICFRASSNVPIRYGKANKILDKMFQISKLVTQELKATNHTKACQNS